MSATFTIDINKWAKKVNLELSDAVMAVCSKVSKDIIYDTPVLTGRLRNNWYASIDTDITKTSDTRTTEEALSDVEGESKKAYGHNFILRNNLPYAYRIEFEGWSHTKAPAGMVRINMAKIKRTLS